MAKRISFNEETQSISQPGILVSDEFVQAYKVPDPDPNDDPMVKLGKGLKDLSGSLKRAHELGAEDRMLEAQAAYQEYVKGEQPYKDKVHGMIKLFNESKDRSGQSLEFFKYHARQQATKFTAEYTHELNKSLRSASNDGSTDLEAIKAQAYETTSANYPEEVTNNMWFRSIQGEGIQAADNAWDLRVMDGHNEVKYNENVRAYGEDIRDALQNWSETDNRGSLLDTINQASERFYTAHEESMKLRPQQISDLQVAVYTDFAKQNAEIGDVDDIQELLTEVQSPDFKINGLGKAAKETLVQNLEEQLIAAERVQKTRSSTGRTDVVNDATGLMYEYLYTSGTEGGAPATMKELDAFLPWLEERMKGHPQDTIDQIKYATLDSLKTKIEGDSSAAYSMSNRERIEEDRRASTELITIKGKIADGMSLTEAMTFIGNLNLPPEQSKELTEQTKLMLNTERVATDFLRDSGRRLMSETVAGTYVTELEAELTATKEMYGVQDNRYVAAESAKFVFIAEVNQAILEVVKQWSAGAEGGIATINDYAAIKGLVDVRIQSMIEGRRAEQPSSRETAQSQDMRSQQQLQSTPQEERTGAQQVRLDQLNTAQDELNTAQGKLIGGLSEARGVATNNIGPIDAIGNWLFDTESTTDNTLSGFLGPDRVGGGSYVPGRESRSRGPYSGAEEAPDRGSDYVTLSKKELGGLYRDVWSSIEVEGYATNRTYKESVKKIQRDKAVFERTIRAQTPDEDGDIVALRQAGVSSITDDSIGRSGLSLEEIQTGKLQYGDKTVEVDRDLIHPAFFPMVNSWDEYESTTDAQWGEVISALSPTVRSLIERDAAVSGRTPAQQVKAIQGVVLQSFFMRDLPGQATTN